MSGSNSESDKSTSNLWTGSKTVEGGIYRSGEEFRDVFFYFILFISYLTTAVNGLFSYWILKPVEKTVLDD